MGTVTLPHTLTPGTTENVTHVQENDAAIVAAVNGGLDGDNLSATVGSQLGLSSSSAARRGKSIIATSESRSNTAYGLLTTPDRVSSVVLPTDGLIFVAYQAMWQESVAGAARAAIFVGANQLSIQDTAAGAPGTQAAGLSGALTAARDRPLFSHGGGLSSGMGNTSFTADVTTGQAVAGAFGASQDVSGVITSFTANVGGPCAVFAAAGTYDISVQFKASSGSVTVKNRKLWVWTTGF